MVFPEQIEKALQAKYDALRLALSARGRMAVAFSGGVDSTLLLKVAHDVLADDVVAITVKSPVVPAREIEEAEAFCRTEGVRHLVIDVDVFAVEGFADNPPDRCYHCKRRILAEIAAKTAAFGIDAIAEGSNVDDRSDYRPGSRAVSEMGVVSPLLDAGMTKADVRALAKALSLDAWDKPAYACLATRFPYGERLSPKRLRAVELAEYALNDEGFGQLRVRVQGATARIEVAPDDIERLAGADIRSRIVGRLKELGFAYVSLDLEGYRKGSMNETL